MHIAHTWTERKIKTEQDFDAVLDNYRILFAYHSNAIEDAGVSMHQTREIFENGKVTNYIGELRHLFETQNQKVCTVFAGTDGKNMDTDQTNQDERNHTDDLPVTYKVL